MTVSVGESLARRLVEWGVDTVFGLPGDGINGLMEGFRRCRGGDRVRARAPRGGRGVHGARDTPRRPDDSVCVARPPGPAAIHLLNGLYDAKLDHVPVLAITGMQETSVLGTRYQQEVHLDRLYQDVAEYNLMVTNPQQMPGVVDIAIRNALTKRGVAHLTFPNDIQVAPVDEDPYRHVGPANPPTSSSRPAPRRARPDPGSDAPRRRRSSTRARRSRCSSASARCTPARRCWPSPSARRADRQDAAGQSRRCRRPSAHDRRARAVGYPAERGGHGGLRHAPHGRDLVSVHQASAEPGSGQGRADRRRPEPGRAPAPGRRRRWSPTPSSPCEALLPLLDQRADRSFLETAQAAMEKWRGDMRRARGPRSRTRSPRNTSSTASTRPRPSDAILTCDSGTIATWAARHWTNRDDRQFYLSGNLATMAPGLPYAIAMQHAFPGRQVIAFVGDGGFAMLMAEFLTAVRNELPIKVVVNNNNAYGQILWEQIVPRLSGVRGAAQGTRGRLRGVGPGVRRVRA